MALEEIWKFRKKVIQELGSGQAYQMLIFPSFSVFDKVWAPGELDNCSQSSDNDKNSIEGDWGESKMRMWEAQRVHDPFRKYC